MTRATQEEIRWHFDHRNSALVGDYAVIDATASDKEKELDMAAFSLGLIRSLRVSRLEQQVCRKPFIQSTTVGHGLIPNSQVEDANSTLPDIEDLFNEKKSYSAHHLNQWMAQALSIGREINLSLSTETPDMFWEDSRRELLLQTMSYFLDVPKRINVMNRKLNYLRDSIEYAKDSITTATSERLERIIILLIAVEVVLGLPSLCIELADYFRKGKEKDQEDEDQQQIKA